MTPGFYVAESGKISYSPFPSALVAPAYGLHLPVNTTAVDLKWQTADVDDDVVSSAVYFGTTDALPLLKDNVASSAINRRHCFSGKNILLAGSHP